MIQNILSYFQVKELRDRVYTTLFFVLVYRLVSFIPLPGIDPSELSELQAKAGSGLLGLLNAFTGGAFSQASVMALGIMPYISASIAIQLFTVVLPYFQKMQKEGESGRNKINQITRWLTILIVLFQAPAYLTSLHSILPPQAFTTSPTFFWFSSFVMLVSFTVFAMWLGERITAKGIGNGVSLLIMVGIIARFPTSFAQEFVSKGGASSGGMIFVFFEILVWFAVIAACLLLVQAVRRVSVQYVKADVRSRGRAARNMNTSGTYIPLKLNSSGVMPIIFAQAVMFLPATMLSSSGDGVVSYFSSLISDINGFWYNFIFALMIVLFTYVYTAVAIPTSKISDDMKRNGAFIPGVKPGKDTASFMDAVMSRITLPGSVFLALLAVMPALVFYLGVSQSFALFYGGTSLLILVGVFIEVIAQVKSYSVVTSYDSISTKSRFNSNSEV